MNVLIIADERKWEADLTAFSVYSIFPAANVYTADDKSREGIHAWIDNLPFPYLLTVRAGTKLLSAFRSEVELALQSLQLETLGWIILSVSEAGPSDFEVDHHSTPVLWKKGCIREGLSRGFANRAFLPFPKLLVTDMLAQVTDCGWSGTTVSATGLNLPKKRLGRLGKPDAEREFIVPILTASASAFSLEPEISILLCAYNEENYIPWAIRSVLAQTFSAWELIIVDDASTDTTATLVAAFMPDSRIHCVRNETNQGKAYSLNRGLQEARGRWIVELDADDWLAPECLELMIKVARRDEGRTALWYSDYYEWVELRSGELRFKGLHRSSSTIDGQRLLEQAVPLALRFYRKETLLQIGGWYTEDPSRSRLYEDFEIIVRLLNIFPIAYVPKALYHRRLRLSSITRRHTNSYVDWKKWMENCGHRKG
ncbi:UDP-Glc:alpha-D-GlcNAc-diphosphoundecaprenol beta-1,3-glucosyltransferase WfgD [compost metagenome]